MEIAIDDGYVRAVTSTKGVNSAALNAGTSPTAHSDRSRQIHAAVAAAQHTHTLEVTLPWVGEVSLPSVDELAFIAGIGALAVFGAVEWPVALVLGTGRLLAHAHRWRGLEAFGEALEHA